MLHVSTTEPIPLSFLTIWETSTGPRGQNDKVLDYYTRALDLRADNRKPGRTFRQHLNNLGTFYASLGQNNKALDYFTRALAIFGEESRPGGHFDCTQ